MLALAAPFATIAQESVAVSYDGYVGFQGPLWAAKDLELFGGVRCSNGITATVSPCRLRSGTAIKILCDMRQFFFN
jgi:hypothetical protein